jgi:hypothetical protein
MPNNFDHLSRLPKPWFKRHAPKYDNERKLIADMGAEMINHHGVLCEYILISNDPSYDTLFGDDRNRRVIRKFLVMVYFDLPAEDDRWSSFGIEGLDNFSMIASIKHFSERGKLDVLPEQAIYSPRVGDIIKPMYNNFYYEVTAWYDGMTSMNFLQLDNVYEIVVNKMTDDHINDPDNLINSSIRPLGAQDIFDDTDFINTMNGSTAIVPNTFPETTGKGKPSPLYKPKAGEKAPNDPFGGF